jgi:hypothetical protein
MKTKDNVAYAPLPKELKGHRNMIHVDLQRKNGRFRSGKSRKADVGRCIYMGFRFSYRFEAA